MPLGEGEVGTRQRDIDSELFPGDSLSGQRPHLCSGSVSFKSVFYHLWSQSNTVDKESCKSSSREMKLEMVVKSLMGFEK